MALNFPDPSDSTVYVDTTTGLKYIYNSTVQAWESALQPPAIVDTVQPQLAITGFIWYDPSNNLLYVRDNNDPPVWVPINTNASAANKLTVGTSVPSSPVAGDLWFDTSSFINTDAQSGGGGRMYLYYQDAGDASSTGQSAQWIDTTPSSTGSIAAQAYFGSSTPLATVDGALWYDTSSNPGVLKVLDNGTFIVANQEVSGVSTLTATTPLSVDASTGAITISVGNASTTAFGVTQYADSAETNAGSTTDRALTPGGLKAGIGNYLPAASQTVAGIVELATDLETQTLTDDTKAITPAGLGAAAATIANPPGVILLYGGATAPTGYLACDGTSYTVAAYPDLAAALGESGQTFSVPNLTGSNVPKVPQITGNQIVLTDQFLPINGVAQYIIKT
jgi:hypothetical protein